MGLAPHRATSLLSQGVVATDFPQMVAVEAANQSHGKLFVLVALLLPWTQPKFIWQYHPGAII